MATLSEKTGLSVGLVVTLAVMLAAGVGTFAKTQADVTYLRSEVAALREADRSLAEEQATQTKQLIEYRSDTRYIIQTLGELKVALENLAAERRVVPARGHR